MEGPEALEGVGALGSDALESTGMGAISEGMEPRRTVAGGWGASSERGPRLGTDRQPPRNKCHQGYLVLTYFSGSGPGRQGSLKLSQLQPVDAVRQPMGVVGG